MVGGGARRQSAAGAPPRTHAALGHQHAQGSSPGWGGEQQQKLADLRRELAASKREAALAQERQASVNRSVIAYNTKAQINEASKNLQVLKHEKKVMQVAFHTREQCLREEVANLQGQLEAMSATANLALQMRAAAAKQHVQEQKQEQEEVVAVTAGPSGPTTPRPMPDDGEALATPPRSPPGSPPADRTPEAWGRGGSSALAEANTPEPLRSISPPPRAASRRSSSRSRVSVCYREPSRTSKLRQGNVHTTSGYSVYVKNVIDLPDGGDGGSSGGGGSGSAGSRASWTTPR